MKNEDTTPEDWGIYFYLFSKPDNWDFSSERIAYDCRIGVKKVQRILKNLENIGYLYRERLSTGKMKYVISPTIGDMEEYINGVLTPSKPLGQKGIEAISSHKSTQNQRNGSRIPLSQNGSEPKRPTYINTEELINTEIYKKKIIKEKISANLDFVDEPELKEILLEFIEYRKQKKRPLTKFSLEKLYKKFKTKSLSEVRVAVDKTIENGWQGVFFPEDNKQFAKNYNKQFEFNNTADDKYDGVVEEINV